MSSGQGHKKGKGRGKKGGRGRGGQSRQNESAPGGLQQRSRQETEQATALSRQQPQQPQQARTPTEQALSGSEPQQAQAEAVSQAAQERTSPQKQGKSKKQRKQRAKADVSSAKPDDESIPLEASGQVSEEKKVSGLEEGLSQLSLSREQQPRVTEPQTVPVSKSDKSVAEPSPGPSGVQGATKESPTKDTSRSQSAVPQGQQPGASSTGTRPKQRAAPPVISAQAPPRSSKAEPRPPLRPDRGGTSGRQIKLRANFVPVKLPQEDIHHYDTDIKAKGMKSGEGYTKNEAPRIIQGMVKEYEKTYPNGPKLVHDKNGKNLYSRCLIPGIGKDKREFKVQFVTDNGKEREYTVVVKWASQVSLYNLNQALEGRFTEIPYDTMQAIEVVFRHLPSMTSIPVGSSFYNPTGREKDLGLGLQMWNGTFVSIRPTSWKMMLNIDTCSTAFYKAQPVLRFMQEFFYLNNIPTSLDKQQNKKFAKEIKTIKIETTHLKRKQGVSGLSANSARNEFFDCEGKQTSVLQYFKEKYGITLRYPDLPCLKLGQKGNCIPMELCNIVKGQRKQGKLSAQQTQEMIRHTAIPAPDRQQKIMDLIRNTNYDQDPFCRDFGFRIGSDMVQITGRVLEPPSMNYGPQNRPSSVVPRDGVWNVPKPMYKPVELREWAMISLQNPNPKKRSRDKGPPFLDENRMDNFINKLVEIGRHKHIRIKPQPCYRVIQRGYEGIGPLFGRLNQNYPNLEVIIVSLPKEDDEDIYYEQVKYHGDIVYGITTQCIKTKNAACDFTDRRDTDTLSNICLKLNAKLGGTSFVLDKAMRSPVLKRPVIIFGADVTHPSAGNVTAPSIAAVVASMDSHPNLYNAEVRVQKHRQEMIAELKDMVKILLKKFRNATGAQPEKILFYRDGVSEGQFKDVLIHELQAIQHACLELHERFKPGITFIVVQKRHHARFFAVDPRDQKGKSRNIPAGTVVDQHVCHPFEFNWYLCSHAGIQGTSKPALYHVLYDDNNFKSDELQILTNQLCHTYVRCPRSVSIPAPAYYAHHVAFRARHHLNEVDRGSSEGSVASGSGEVGLPAHEMIRAVTLHRNVNNTMYFA